MSYAGVVPMLLPDQVLVGPGDLDRRGIDLETDAVVARCDMQVVIAARVLDTGYEHIFVAEFHRARVVDGVHVVREITVRQDRIAGTAFEQFLFHASSSGPHGGRRLADLL